MICREYITGDMVLEPIRLICMSALWIKDALMGDEYTPEEFLFCILAFECEGSKWLR